MKMEDNNENLNNVMCEEEKECNNDNSNNSNTNGSKKKLPYFHRVLSKEDHQLIGDITPKPIDTKTTTLEPSNTVHSASVWNAAQTYEERNFTNWGIDKMKTILEDFNCISSSIAINTKNPEVTGTATIAHMKGKPRYIYDFSFKLTFDINDNYQGNFQIDDVSPDDLDDINIQIQFTKEPPSSEYSSIKSYIMKDFKLEFKKKILEFEKEFRSI